MRPRLALVTSGAEPERLTDEERAQWFAFAHVLTLLPGVLETQMQRDGGIGHFDYLVMSWLSTAPERTLRMSELASSVCGTLSRLSNAATRLERQGWLTRRPNPEDGRATLVTLTDAGRQKVESVAPAHEAELRRLFFEPLTAAQSRQLATACRRILAVAQES